MKKIYTCLVYGEGRKEKIFLINLIDLKKFQYHTSLWHFNYDNASGGSPKEILEQCKKNIGVTNYDLILCFVDLDKLKTDFPKKWEQEKQKLEKEYSKCGIEIVWQINKLEDEFMKVLGKKEIGKKEINKLANKQIEKFINSEFWKRILRIIKDKERHLNNKLNIK